MNKETRQHVDASRRGVVARQPLGVKQDDRLAAAHGNRFVDVDDAAIDVGCVHAKLDGAGIWSVDGRLDLWRHRRGLRSHRLSGYRDPHRQPDRDQQESARRFARRPGVSVGVVRHTRDPIPRWRLKNDACARTWRTFLIVHAISKPGWGACGVLAPTMAWASPLQPLTLPARRQSCPRQTRRRSTGTVFGNTSSSRLPSSPYIRLKMPPSIARYSVSTGKSRFWFSVFGATTTCSPAILPP